jgi:hypothetical protein
MKKFALALLVLLTAQVGRAATYSCSPQDGSSVTEEIILTVHAKSASYKYSSNLETICKAKLDHVIESSGKTKFTISGCGSDVYLTLSENFGQGESKVAGYARLDNYEEGGYFPSNFKCTEQQ